MRVGTHPGSKITCAGSGWWWSGGGDRPDRAEQAIIKITLYITARGGEGAGGDTSRFTK